MVAITQFLASAIACASVLQGAEAQRYIVTGVTTGGAQPRYELRDLQANHGPMWNLFVLAMERFQADGQGNLLSYYQFAGIHGAPYRAWDGVGQSGSGGGYCPHSSNLFGPWHRPYLAAFEQRLSYHAKAIADNWQGGDRGTYQEAARNLRLPYWDWAQNGARVMPESMVQQSISVTRPNGQRQTIRNPLSRYRFHPLDSNALIFSPTNQYPETKRAPQGGGANPSSNNAQVEAGFRANRGNNRQSVYNILASGGNYNQISNWGIGSVSNNFEAVHNNIHSGFGGNSHMSLPVLAAYDPAFWFHHANVDRLLAIWQKLYPRTYVRPTRQSGGTYTIDQNSIQGVNSPLTPFHRNAQGQFWTSAGARQTRNFGYTYPELRDNPSAGVLRSRVNRLYGSAVGVSRNVAKASSSKAKRDVDPTLLTVPEVNIELDIAAGETVYQYTVEIKMPKTVNNAAYNVLLFLGTPSDDASQWLTDPNLVGFQGSLGFLNGADPEATMAANVFLTDAIVERYAAGEIDSLDKETVEEYLTSKLVWRAEQNGQAITAESNPAVEMHIVSQEVDAPTTDDGFPEYHGQDQVAPVNTTQS